MKSAQRFHCFFIMEIRFCFFFYSETFCIENELFMEIRLPLSDTALIFHTAQFYIFHPPFSGSTLMTLIPVFSFTFSITSSSAFTSVIR